MHKEEEDFSEEQDDKLGGSEGEEAGVRGSEEQHEEDSVAKGDAELGGKDTHGVFVGVYHEQSTPILSVLSESLTLLPEYCLAFFVFSWK